MAYDVKATANRILGLKNDWNTASASGDTEKANQIAANAQNYYKQLRENGYEDVAQKLYDSNYDQSKKYINDYFAAQGRSAIRPYLYTAGQKYGLSQSDIDNALSYNETTGEVTFGGKNMGKPAAISSDGVSYWDTDTLDNAFNDYISRSGTTRKVSDSINQENENLFSRYNNLSDTYTQDYNDYMDLVKQNPYTSEEGKAILSQYNLAGYTGRQNALASGAASNGGNVDSYSAANAMRQQAALTAQGQQAALDAYNAKVQAAYNSTDKLESARQLLSDMGVNISRVAADNETALNNETERSETVKNGDVSRKKTISEVTGYVPDEWVRANNIFFNDDGTLKDENIDYKNIIEQAEKSGNTEMAQQARVARAYKIFGNYTKYGTYDDGDYSVNNQQQTEPAKEFDKQLDNSVQLANISAQNNLDLADKNNQADIDKINAQADATVKTQDNASKNNILEANNTSKNTIAESAATTDNAIRAYSETGGGIGGTSSSSSSSSEKTTLPESQVKAFKDYFNDRSHEWHDGADAIVQENGSWVVKSDGVYIAYCILNDATINDDQKRWLLQKFNVPNSDINQAYINLSNDISNNK